MEAARKRAAEMEGARKRAEEDAARKRAEEDAARKRAEEDAARKQAAEDAARKRAAEEEAAAARVSLTRTHVSWAFLGTDCASLLLSSFLVEVTTCSLLLSRVMC